MRENWESYGTNPEKREAGKSRNPPADWFLSARTDVQGPSGDSRRQPTETERTETAVGLEGFGEPLELFSVTESKFILNFKPLPYIFDILRRLKSYEGQRLLELLASISLCLYFLSYCDISPPLPISHRTHNARARTRTNWPLVRQNRQSRCCHAEALNTLLIIQSDIITPQIDR